MGLMDDMKVLLSTLEFPLFESLNKPTPVERRLICKGKDAVADGFIPT